MSVYIRQRNGENIPKYIVINDITNRILEEFRYKVSALNFAKSNQCG